MKPLIINKCTKQFRIDHQKIVQRILYNIPNRYLVGLSEVVLLCDKGKGSNRMRYYCGQKGEIPRIEINLGFSDYNKYPLYSIFSFNMDFILKVNEHIFKLLKSNPSDSDFLKFHKSRINYKWMYLGVWTPILYLFSLFLYPIRSTDVFRKFIVNASNEIMKKVK